MSLRCYHYTIGSLLIRSNAIWVLECKVLTSFFPPFSQLLYTYLSQGRLPSYTVVTVYKQGYPRFVPFKCRGGVKKERIRRGLEPPTCLAWEQIPPLPPRHTSALNKCHKWRIDAGGKNNFNLPTGDRTRALLLMSLRCNHYTIGSLLIQSNAIWVLECKVLTSFFPPFYPSCSTHTYRKEGYPLTP